jgi:digeranylgeranylglycerophospholipid reductase
VFEQSPEGVNLENLQEKFIDALPYFKNMEPIEIHAGAARADGGVKHHVYKNIVLVGDSARQLNPMAGEGIRHALQAGRISAEVINEWLNKPNATENGLKEKYEKKWNEIFGTAWRLSHLFMRHALTFNDKQWDTAISAAQQLSAEDAFELFFHYKFSVLLKHPMLAKEALKIKFFQKSGNKRN